jgi:hypothetical protein
MTSTKVSPVACPKPYVTLSGSITPAELCGMLFDPRDAAASADNGLGNRPLYVYAVREKLVANPKATIDRAALADEVARNILSVYRALKPTGPFLSAPIAFTPSAADLYEREIYPALNDIPPTSANAAKLFGRLATNARKIAAILAVIAGESGVGPGAIEAADAWVRHGAATINAIASTVEERMKTAQARRDAEAVLMALRKVGGASRLVPSRDAQRAAHLTAERLKAAVACLVAEAPSPIVVSAEPRVAGNGAELRRSMLRLT